MNGVLVGLDSTVDSSLYVSAVDESSIVLRSSVSVVSVKDCATAKIFDAGTKFLNEFILTHPFHNKTSSENN